MKRHPILIVTALLLPLGSAALNTAAQERASVRTAQPTAAVDSRRYAVPGRTAPFEMSTIYTRATGIVKERHFDIGDTVKAGDVLAVIDAPEVDRAVESAQAAVDQAKARADNARVLAQRAENLLSSRAISKEEAEQRTADAAQLDAAVRLAEAELANWREQQKFATVLSPIDGVIAARNFDRGDRVQGDSAGAAGYLYRIVRLDQLRFVIAAPPDLAMQMSKDTAAQVRFNELPGQTLDAKFYRSSSVFDEATGTMRVELLLPNPDRLIPAGLTGTATFTLTPAANRFLVPTNTVLYEKGQAQLATITDGKVSRQPVTVGRNLGPRIEVMSDGLTTETQVIVNPNAMLRVGDAVDVVPPPKPEASR